jgi:hypothetical protein
MLKVFTNRELRRIFEPQRGSAVQTEEQDEKVHNECR